MELIIQLEHILAVVVALGAIIGWLASKVAKAQKLEDRIVALEEEKAGSKETKDRIWTSLERIEQQTPQHGAQDDYRSWRALEKDWLSSRPLGVIR